MKSGGRFSANALSASVFAGAPMSLANAAFSRLRAAAIGSRSDSTIVRLVSINELIGRAASVRACSRVTGISSSGFPPDLIGLVERQLTLLPNIEYFEGRSRGYIRHEVTRDEWRAEFRFAETVAVPDAPVSTAATFVAQHGTLLPVRQ